jgi:hypothetical protein
MPRRKHPWEIRQGGILGLEEHHGSKWAKDSMVFHIGTSGGEDYDGLLLFRCYYSSPMS